MAEQSLPTHVKQYFWGDDINQLGLIKNKKYILQVLLERGDQKAINWLFSTFNMQTIKNLLPQIKLSKKSARFWNIYFS